MSTHRRDFAKLALGSAVTGAAAFLGAADEASAKVHNSQPGIKLCGQASAKPTDEELKFWRQMGCGYVSVGSTPDLRTADGFKQIKKTYADAGITVWNIGNTSVHNMPEVTLNLPGRDKMQAPWYRDVAAGGLPRFSAGGATAIVIAGESHGVAGAVTREATAPLYLDLHLEPGARFAQALPPGHNAFVYVYRGEVTIGGRAVPEKRMAILANDPAADGVVLESAAGAKALLVAGRPLGEPIAQYGPFVMNTEQEIYQALSDYRDGRLA